MINKKYLKLLRTRKKINYNNFLYEKISERIIDSIDLIKINFTNILEIGINDNKIYNYLYERYKESNIESSDILNKKENDNRNNYFEIDINNLKIKPSYYDLVFSNNFLHLTSNFEYTINCIYNSLSDNGFFIAIIPDVENMYQLVNTMYKVDMTLYDGVYKRFNSTYKVDDILSLLKKINFKIPTINVDTIKIEYSDFKNLLVDCRSTNLSYCYHDKKKSFENKYYFEYLEKEYKKNYFDKNFLLDIKLNIISAWK